MCVFDLEFTIIYQMMITVMIHELRNQVICFKYPILVLNKNEMFANYSKILK